jgi:glycosyltransferase involved in cell wall biosynthesis
VNHRRVPVSPEQQLSEYQCLFDPEWYVGQVGVCLEPGQSALDHFLSVGREANLAPGPWLDSSWYWESNPDVAGAGVPAFDHFVLNGIVEDRRPHPDFDVVSYALRNELEGMDPFEVLADWVSRGGPTSGVWRLANLGLLDLEWLRATHGWEQLSDEECVERLLEGPDPRPGLLFDPEWYVGQVGVCLEPGQSALDHFLSVGREANLAPGPWLDSSWYWESNPDVAGAGVPAFDHFVLNGIVEDRRPHPDFDVVSYALRNELEGMDPFEVLADWVSHGGPTSGVWRLANLGLLDLEWLRATHGWEQLSDEECVERLLEGPDPRPGLLFDPEWYVGQVGVCLEPGQSALDHFLSVGREANLAPGPWLDSSWYWESNPDVAGAGVPAFDHYLFRGEDEGRAPSKRFVPRLAGGILPRPPGVLQRTNAAWSTRLTGADDLTDPEWFSTELDHAVGTDPRIGTITLTAAMRSLTEPFTGERPTRRLIAAVEMAADAEVLIFVPHFVIGGADRVAANVATEIARRSTSSAVAVIATDRGLRESIHWFPEGVPCVSLLPPRADPLTDEESSEIVARLITAVRPRFVININSRAAWVAYRDFGPALAELTSLRAMLFCRDRSDDGHTGGHADEFLEATIGELSTVVFDNAAFIEELRSEYSFLPADVAKLQVVHQPSTVSPLRPSQHRNVSQVLWVGRLTSQKRPDLLAAVARLMPEVTFHVFGYPTDRATLVKFDLLQPNVTVNGLSNNLSDLSPEEYGALLFTSDYEGLPTLLIEIASLGIPIVASEVGGVPELIAPGCGWVISASDDARRYVEALRQALDPSAGATAAEALQQRVEAEYSWQSFARSSGVAGLLD